ncbi:hypothetical protein ACJX0J_028323, partial [Zea mays]
LTKHYRAIKKVQNTAAMEVSCHLLLIRMEETSWICLWHYIIGSAFVILMHIYHHVATSRSSGNKKNYIGPNAMHINATFLLRDVPSCYLLCILIDNTSKTVFFGQR